MYKISACIPVYNSEEYIEDTLDSVYRQDYSNLEIIISIDLNQENKTVNENLKKICDKYKEKRNTKIYVQKKHLGWVKNCNFLIKHTTGQYLAIIPDDDIIPPNYFSLLLESFKDSETVNSFPMIKCFGTHNKFIKQASIKGTILERICDVINNHCNGVSFRGLIKKDIPQNLLYLDETQPNDFLADTIWILQHAIAGNLIANNNVIYKKRYHKSNVHLKWQHVSLSEKINVWAKHCATLLNYANPWISQKDKELVHICAVNRLLSKTNIKFLPVLISKNDKINLTNIFNSNLIKKNAIVLGAGFQGCLIALMLRKHNYSVTLIDQCADIMTRASSNQEGKIHMGFIYSLDESLETGKKMMCDALNFANQVEYLLEHTIDWNTLTSSTFNYIVPNDSHLNGDELEIYFDKLQKMHDSLVKLNPKLSYLGKNLDKIFTRIPIPETMNQDMFQACFSTQEVSIIQSKLIPFIKNALINNGVKLIFNETVTNVSRNFSGFTINNIYQCNQIFNCLWEGQNKIDKQLGMIVDPDINYRIKFGIVSDDIPELSNMPSYSIVQGPYGDFVNYSNNQYYFSWYPYSRYGMVINDDIPTEWKDICNQQIPNTMIEELCKKHLQMFQKIFNQEFQFNNYKIKAGIIVANGDTDITNKNTSLHSRNKNPISFKNQYYTISTGKFTSAPYNTFLLEQMLIKHNNIDYIPSHSIIH